MRVGADRLLGWRLAHPRSDGGKVAVDAVLVWACARALARHPRLNGVFREDRLVLQPQVNVGVAVAAGEELHVPVIRQAQSKDIAGIDRELAVLAPRPKPAAWPPPTYPGAASRSATWACTRWRSSPPC